MSGQLGELVVSLQADIARFQSDMGKAVKISQDNASAMANAFSTVHANIAKIATVMTTVAAGMGFKKLIEESVEWNLEAAKMARTMGTTVEQASKMDVALKMTGIGADVAQAAALRLSKDLTAGTDKFDKYGISVKDANGNLLPMPEIMSNVNQALLSMHEGTQRNMAAMDIYGRSWGELQAILKLTPAAMNEARDMAERLHLVVGPQGVAQAKEYRQNLRELELVGKSLAIQMGNELLPAVLSVGSALGNQGVAGASLFAQAISKSVRAVQEAAVYWGAAFDKKKAWVDTGGLVGHMFKSNRDEYQRQIAAIQAGESGQMAEIAKGYEPKKISSAINFDTLLNTKPFRSVSRAATAAKGLTDQQKEYQEQIKNFLRDSWDNAANELAAGNFGKDTTKKLGFLTGKFTLPKSPAMGLGVGQLKSLEQQQAEEEMRKQLEENTRKAELLNAEIQRGTLEAAKSVAELNGEWDKARKLEDQLLRVEIKRAQLTGKIYDIPLIQAQQARLTQSGSLFGAFGQGFGDTTAAWGDAAKQMQDIGENTAQQMQNDFSNIFFDGMQGKLHSLADYFNEFTKSLEKSLADFLSKQLIEGFTSGSIWKDLGGLFDNGFTVDGFRASGGDVTGGSTYLVGEKGPELFTPGVSGSITPNSQLGGSTFAPVYNIDARNSTLSHGQIQAIVDQSVRQSKADILNSMNRGGEFAVASGRMSR